MDCYSCFSPVKPKEKKATSAFDFFGSTPVQRESSVFHYQHSYLGQLLPH